MIIEVTLKDPDGFYECVKDAVEDTVKPLGLNEREHEALLRERLDDVWDKLSKWVEYKEYLRVRFDTDAGTVTVLEEK